MVGLVTALTEGLRALGVGRKEYEELAAQVGLRCRIRQCKRSFVHGANVGLGMVERTRPKEAWGELTALGQGAARLAMQSSPVDYSRAAVMRAWGGHTIACEQACLRALPVKHP